MKYLIDILIGLLVLGSIVSIPHIIQAQPEIGELSLGHLDTLFQEANDKGKYQLALDYREESIVKASEQLVTDSTYAEYLGDAGYLSFELKLYDRAKVYLEEAVSIYREKMDVKSPDYPIILMNLGLYHMSFNEFEEAEKLYKEVEELYNSGEREEDLEYCKCLNNLAQLYRNNRKFNKAKGFYSKAISCKYKYPLELIRARISLANSIQGLGITFMQNREYPKAKLFIKKSLILRKEHATYIYGLNNMLSLAVASRDSLLGTEYFEKFKAEMKKMAVPSQLASSYHTLAVFFFRKGDFSMATKYSEMAVEMKSNKLKMTEYHPSYRESLRLVGLCYNKTRKYEKALLIQLLLLSFMDKEQYNYSAQLNTIAGVYYTMNNIDSAYTYCMRGILAGCQIYDRGKISSLKNNTGHNIIEPTEFINLSEVEYKYQKKIHANLSELVLILKRKYQKKEEEEIEGSDLNTIAKQIHYVCVAGIKIGKKLQEEVKNEDAKLRFSERYSFFSKEGLRNLSRLKDKALHRHSLKFIEQNKSVVLSSFLRIKMADRKNLLPEKLLSNYNQLIQKYDSLLVFQLDFQKDTVGLEAFENQMIEIVRAIETLTPVLDSSLRSLPKSINYLNEQKGRNLQEIQNKLGSHTLMVEYFVTENTTYILGITRMNFVLIPVKIKQRSLNNSVTELRKVLDVRKPEENWNENHSKFKQESYNLYLKLVEPVLNSRDLDLEDKTNLVIINDGNLNNLPFEILLTTSGRDDDKYRDLDYLLKKYSISYAYSSTIWLENILKGEYKKKGSNILGIAPFYEEEPLVASKERKFRGDMMRNLPFAHKEVMFLQNRYGAKSKIKEASGNKSFFLKNAQDYSVIHLAMHGIYNKKNPLASELVFSNETAESLPVYEIKNLNLSKTKMVILSACETGYGKFQMGEGVISLARSFMYAGASSLVVTLWEVEDKTCLIIIKFFYKNLEQGMDKAVALQKAKIMYLESLDESNRRDHPAYWSAFITIGDTSPIDVCKKRSWIKVGFGGLVIMLLGILFFQSKNRKVAGRDI